MKKMIVFLVVFYLSLSLWARLGMTRQECLEKYGTPIAEQRQYNGQAGIDLARYKVGLVDNLIIYITVCYINNKAEFVYYYKSESDTSKYKLFDSFSTTFFSENEKEYIKKANNFDKYSAISISTRNKTEVNGYGIIDISSVLDYYHNFYPTLILCQKDSVGNPVFYVYDNLA